MKEKLLDAFRTWTSEMEMSVRVKFIRKGHDLPLTGKQYVVRLYDKDIFSDDDYLGHAHLNEHGEAHITFYPADVRKDGLDFESFPDLYILLFKEDTVHFQSKVWDDVNFEKSGHFVLQEGEVVDFGTFLVE